MNSWIHEFNNITQNCNHTLVFLNPPTRLDVSNAFIFVEIKKKTRWLILRKSLIVHITGAIYQWKRLLVSYQTILLVDFYFVMESTETFASLGKIYIIMTYSANLYLFSVHRLYGKWPAATLLIDRELNQCNCKKREKNGIARFWKFDNLEQFINNCNMSEVTWISRSYRYPVFRRKPLTLLEITKGIICNLGIRLENHKIPSVLKNEIEKIPYGNHHHYKISLNEKIVKHHFVRGGWEHFLFDLNPTPISQQEPPDDLMPPPKSLISIVYLIQVQNEADATSHQLQGLTV